MFTWNFKYISKARLSQAFSQLMLNPAKGDILIRIHTAIHTEEEAVDLAKFIVKLVPGAHIFGTSTSAVIVGGKLFPDQCVISVTQMSGGRIKTALLPTYGDDGKPLKPDTLCENVKSAVIEDDTKLLLEFLTGKYLDVYSYIEKCNTYFPNVQMIGGLANTPEISLRRFIDSGFVFNEKEWSEKGTVLAAISGENVESYSSCATGVQVIGEEVEITDTFGTCILSIDGKDAANEYRIGVGDELRNNPELTNLFPYVYSDISEIPILVRFSNSESISDIFRENDPANSEFYSSHPDIDRFARHERINANHNVKAGKKLKRAFIYDRKIISDNRSLFRQIENFEKAETLFGYSCIARSMIYSNCVKWELSAYENSNMCGCITEGEIAHVDGRNTFANCSFVVSVIGEESASQPYNPFAFSHTDSLVDDNRELLNYLYNIEHEFVKNEKSKAADSLKTFVRDCEMKLLYSENEDIPNAAAMNMDMKLKGYDRICMINVTDVSSMKTVFSEQLIDLTYKNYLTKCISYAKQKDYSIYMLEGWTLAIAAPSYMVALSEFARDMEILQRELFEVSEEYIAIVPLFCVIDDCCAENLTSAYYSALTEMSQKNIQFYSYNARRGQLDEESIRERYHMVNVINYAIAHDKVIPYFQGIHDNVNKTIHHYESLMRLQGEDGEIYYPGSFLDVARSFGLLYDSISKIMIKKVFERFKNIENKSVSINLGMRDIKNREIVEYIYKFLSSVKYPHNFVFEILENEDIDDYDELMLFVDTIHSLGGKISIDDFGSGFSNLQHIASINSDYLKIDGSIVKRCCIDEQSANLIALISGWKRLSKGNFSIIAEFVENEDIQKLLLDFNIDYSQGYLFSRPSPDIDDT
ncbi:MAG: EAL domain-containing protein [Ruminococcus sp.]|nr:EAL domain-containing protein [Ruminococcus sp.]